MSLFTRCCTTPLCSSRSVELQRRMKDGTRFGPKMATDGGRIFQSSSRDVEKVIKRKCLTPEQVEEYYQRGILTQWIATPKRIRGKTWVEYDGVTGWRRGVSRRTGVFAKKIGMRREVDMWGLVHPVTVVQMQNNQVVQVKGQKDHQTKGPYCTLQLGAGLKKMEKSYQSRARSSCQSRRIPKGYIG